MFCNTVLEEVESASYLELIFNNKLKFSKHVLNIASKTNNVLGIARHKFWNCPQNVRESVYTTIIRPKLEYACAAWDPHHKKDIMTLESVLIKGARFCLQNYVPLASVTEIVG